MVFNYVFYQYNNLFLDIGVVLIGYIFTFRKYKYNYYIYNNIIII